jgi:hypothetical protein
MLSTPLTTLRDAIRTVITRFSTYRQPRPLVADDRKRASIVVPIDPEPATVDTRPAPIRSAGIPMDPAPEPAIAGIPASEVNQSVRGGSLSPTSSSPLGIPRDASPLAQADLQQLLENLR